MNYICVKWRHNSPTDPRLLYSELNDARWETRKVEAYDDGSVGFADGTRAVGGTTLGLEPIPELPDIAASAEFDPRTIAASDFEELWRRAICGESPVHKS